MFHILLTEPLVLFCSWDAVAGADFWISMRVLCWNLLPAQASVMLLFVLLVPHPQACFHLWNLWVIVSVFIAACPWITVLESRLWALFSSLLRLLFIMSWKESLHYSCGESLILTFPLLKRQLSYRYGEACVLKTTYILQLTSVVCRFSWTFA